MNPVRTAPPGALLALALAATGAAAQRQAPLPLDTLTVSVASRVSLEGSAATRSVQVLDRDDIDRLGTTLAEVLTRALGVDVYGRSAAQADIAIRGASFEQALVLVDGIRVSDDQTGHFDLDVTVPLDAIERIEILRGPASAVYGPDAVGGVINIVTRNDDRTRLHLGGGADATLNVGAAHGWSAGPTRVMTSADYRSSDGHRPGTDYEILQGRIGAIAPLGTGRLSTSIGAAARDFGAADFYAAFDSYEETRTIDGSMRWTADATTGLRLEPSLAFRHHRDDFILIRDDPEVYHNEHDGYQAVAELVARHEPSERVALAWGMEGDGAWLESNALGSRRELRAALFAEAAIGSADNFLVTTGLRGDWHSTYDGFLSPSVAASLRLNDAVLIHASAARGFRAPTFTERYYVDPGNIGSPDLDPERFWSAELGIAAAPAVGARLTGSVFVRDAHDMIDWARPENAPTDAAFRTMNVENATFVGGEATVGATLVGIAVDARAMVVGFDDSAAPGYEGKYALNPLTRSFALTVDAPVRPLRVTLEALSAKRQAEDPYFRVDGRLGYAFGDAEVYGEFRNITDAEYLDASARVVPGRSFFVGARWTAR